MEDQEGFTVKDRRRFMEGSEEAEKSAKGPEKVEKKPNAPTSPTAEEGQSSIPPIEINFASFIFSLGRSAFVHLGEEPDPATGESRVSLPMAKETIDIISLLEEKTKGNLTKDEEQLLKNILFALRMKYVEMASKRA